MTQLKGGEIENTQAVIAAAGWGTRFLPLTKSLPKEMLPLLNKPLIQYSVEEAAACGAELVVIITSMGKRALEDYFDRSLELEHVLEQKGESLQLAEIRRLSSLADICYVRQTEQLGLGHAVLTARKLIGDEPFLLLLPDDIFECGEQVLKQMVAISEQYQSSVLAVKPVADNKLSRYGIIEPRKVAERIYEVKNLVEKPAPAEAPSKLAVMGRYVLSPGIFATLAGTAPGHNQEIQLTDALQRMRQNQPLYAYEFEGESYDGGTPWGLLETTIAMTLRDSENGPRLKQYLERLLRTD
ncbi:MAG: UTP--glucose-1-phosphate uridylyltransferase GalU [Chloroflexota bacterium]